MKIKIDNRDLIYTIDMYSTFTLEREEESETQYLMEEEGIESFTEFNEKYDAEYDMEGYRNKLASESINLLWNAFTTQDGKVKSDGIVNDITLINTGSPRFYNYTTDWYVAEWDIDKDKLVEYVSTRPAAFKEYLYDTYNSYEIINKLNRKSDDYDEEMELIAMLDFYTRREFPEDDYLDSMYEVDGSEYVTFKKIEETK